MRRTTLYTLFFLVGFCALKWARHYTLSYSFNDMYAFLQMSVSWLDGRPFLYDNIWGYHHRIHNYYTVLLWAPFIRLGGAYGLFAAQTGLLLLAVGLVAGRLARDQFPAWVQWSLVAGLMLGPVSLWLNDHPNIGWHTELTYLPLALLFALALTTEKRGYAWLAGVLVVLVKEDGAILAALIYLAWLALDTLSRHPETPLATVLHSRRFWGAVVGWALMFGLGMGWLAVKNEAGEPRLKNTLAILSQSGASTTFAWAMARLVGQSLLLLAGVITYLGVLTRPLAASSRQTVWIIFGVGVGVITVLNVVQSSFYYGQPAFALVALTWPPRFVLVWAFALAFCVLYLLSDVYRVPQPWNLTPVVLFIITLVVGQLVLCYQVRPDLPTGADLKNLLRLRPAADKQIALLQPADLAMLRRLARLLPPHSSVFAFDYAVPVFHKHYEIWPTGKQFKPADVAIIPANDFQGLTRTSGMPPTYRAFPAGAYVLYAAPEFEPYIRAALATPGTP